MSLTRFMIVAVAAGIPVMCARSNNNSEALTLHQQLARDIFKQLIEINTTEKNGSSRAAQAMAERLRTAGFPESDLQIIGPNPKNLNLVARYRGSGAGKPVLFIVHLDVVEALPSDWSMDPFTFTERDGYFYGRGTTDIKCEAADLVANFIRLKKEGFVPSRDIILALTDDEESGDANGVRWLLADRRALIDAEYCINPDGGSGDMRKGKHVVMDVQTSEKTYLSFQLEVKNSGGHSSLPVKDNAIYRLAAGLVRLSKYDFPVRLNETTRMFFERTAGSESGQLKHDMMAILGTPLDTLAARRLSENSAYYNALLRTTMVPTMLSAGHAENALPQTARAVVNARLLPEDDADEVQSTLQRVLADSEIVLTRLNKPSPGPVTLLRKDVLDPLERITTDMWPGVVVTPVMSTGGTDGKPLRQAGIPVFGISGMFTDIDDVRAHGKDERIGVKEFYEGVEFMYRFIKMLTSGK